MNFCPIGRVSFEFQHNVCGRSIYAEGTIDAVLFLAKKVRNFGPGWFTIWPSCQFFSWNLILIEAIECITFAILLWFMSFKITIWSFSRSYEFLNSAITMTSFLIVLLPVCCLLLQYNYCFKACIRLEQPLTRFTVKIILSFIILIKFILSFIILMIANLFLMSFNDCKSCVNADSIKRSEKDI